MEIIGKNLLVCITALANSIFVSVWAQKQNTAFEMEFSFMREQNRRRQLLLGTKLMAIVSVVSYTLYAMIIIVCRMGFGWNVIQISEVQVWGLVFPVLVMTFYLLRMSEFRMVKVEKGGAILLTLFFPYIAFPLLILLMQYLRVDLDQYTGYFSVMMVLLIIWATYRNRKAWREGDY